MAHCTAMFLFFFFNDTATTEIYTLSLHDALPISPGGTRLGQGAVIPGGRCVVDGTGHRRVRETAGRGSDRKSTRLNSSHSQISYAVFCLKKKKKILNILITTLHSHYLHVLHICFS